MPELAMAMALAIVSGLNERRLVAVWRLVGVDFQFI